jgi:drug/metabolite transporter (DMT)-like permease
LNSAPAISAGAQRARAIQMLVFCTLLWALSFPAMKALALAQQNLLPQAGSWFFTSLSVVYRFGLAGILLLPFVAGQWRTLRWREAEQALVVGGFGGVGILFQMDALSYTSASTSAFLTQGYCVFIPLWVALVSRRWPSLKVFLSVALVLAGVGVLAEINFHSFRLGRGELETLIASLMFTGQILNLERPRYAENRPLCMTTVMMFVMAVMAVPLAVATAPNAAAWWQAYASPATAGMLGLITVFCTLAAFCLMTFWQRRVSATEAGLIYCVEPVFASVMALFLPGILSRWADIGYANESLTVRLLIGGGLIMAANVLILSRWLEPQRVTL